jgi:hypothetical protein
MDLVAQRPQHLVQANRGTATHQGNEVASKEILMGEDWSPIAVRIGESEATSYQGCRQQAVNYGRNEPSAAPQWRARLREVERI